MSRRVSKAAYSLVDLGSLNSQFRREVVEDAEAGGGEFGVRVVEEAHNGPARSPIYGYYHDVLAADGVTVLSNDETKWNEAKAKFDVEEVDEDDDDVEERLRRSAAEGADETAEKVRLAEDARVAAVTKEDPKTAEQQAAEAAAAAVAARANPGNKLK